MAKNIFGANFEDISLQDVAMDCQWLNVSSLEEKAGHSKWNTLGRLPHL